MGKSTLFYDIMVGGVFLCTMRYRYLPCFGIDMQDMINEIFERRPSLRQKRFTIATDDFNWTVEPMEGRGK